MSILLSPALLGPPAAKCWKSQLPLCDGQASYHRSSCAELPAPKHRPKCFRKSSQPIRVRIFTVMHLWHRQFTGMCWQCSRFSPTVALFIITFTFHTQKERLVGKKEQYGSVKRLKKAARQRWARWASWKVTQMQMGNILLFYYIMFIWVIEFLVTLQTEAILVKHAMIHLKGPKLHFCILLLGVIYDSGEH